MSDDADRSVQHFTWTGITILALFVIVLILFLPLGLALAEYQAFGTHRVEDFCRDAGIHGFLSTFYEPLINLFR